MLIPTTSASQKDAFTAEIAVVNAVFLRPTYAHTSSFTSHKPDLTAEMAIVVFSSLGVIYAYRIDGCGIPSWSSAVGGRSRPVKYCRTYSCRSWIALLGAQRSSSRFGRLSRGLFERDVIHRIHAMTTAMPAPVSQRTSSWPDSISLDGESHLLNSRHPSIARITWC